MVLLWSKESLKLTIWNFFELRKATDENLPKTYEIIPEDIEVVGIIEIKFHNLLIIGTTGVYIANLSNETEDIDCIYDEKSTLADNICLYHFHAPSSLIILTDSNVLKSIDISKRYF